jgi:plastocyanin
VISHAARHAKRTRARLLVPALTVTLLALAGCGSSSSSSTSSSTPAAPAATATTSSTAATSTTAPAGGAASSLSLAADPEGQLSYDKKSLAAKAGNVSIAFTNKSPVAHNVTIESSSGSTVGSTPTFEGGAKTLSVTLKPGSYKFYCSVPGHRQAGMEGTLTVQ